jgi:hypothetical protein
MNNSHRFPIGVCSSRTFEAKLTKNKLENNGIASFLKDELMGTIAPLHSVPGGAGEVQVSIAQRDIEKARNFIEQL